MKDMKIEKTEIVRIMKTWGDGWGQNFYMEHELGRDVCLKTPRDGDGLSLPPRPEVLRDVAKALTEMASIIEKSSAKREER